MNRKTAKVFYVFTFMILVGLFAFFVPTAYDLAVLPSLAQLRTGQTVSKVFDKFNAEFQTSPVDYEATDRMICLSCSPQSRDSLGCSLEMVSFVATKISTKVGPKFFAPYDKLSLVLAMKLKYSSKDIHALFYGCASTLLKVKNTEALCQLAFTKSCRELSVDESLIIESSIRAGKYPPKHLLIKSAAPQCFP